MSENTSSAAHLSSDPVKAVIEGVIRNEGGVADVGDGKGLTRWGQTPDWLAQFNLPTPRNEVEAASNYRQWLHKTALIHVCGTDDLFAFAVIDYAVHSGHVRVVKALQQLVGVAVDGVLGAQTKAALASADRGKLAARLIAERARFLASLVYADPKRNLPYLRGWFARLSRQIGRLG